MSNNEGVSIKPYPCIHELYQMFSRLLFSSYPSSIF